MADGQPHLETHEFAAEVSRLLHLMVHSVYSEREIFLRELISNASDACDKLRYEAITAPDLVADDPAFRITLTVDAEARTLTVSDNGIGMDHDDLVSHLGTICRSGTAAYAAALADGAKADVSLIGQFGVGFYAAFMVADRVEVTSRKAGDTQGWLWSSDGSGRYTIAPASRAGRGTDVTLHLKHDADEYLGAVALRRIVRTYSDHIAVPVLLAAGEGEPETLNTGAALWMRPKSEITPETYAEFFHHTGGFGDPALTLHYHAEGTIDYRALLFVPGTRPFDLFDPAREAKVKLYVKRVYITDEPDAVLPKWLRFVKGVIDSEDLPLNISREMLQNNPVLARIKKAVTGKVLAELEKCAKDNPETFEKIWEAFGPVLKEGIYEDADRRDALLKLARFRTTAHDGWTSLADYLARKKDLQSAIYFVSGPELEALKRSSHLEGYKARGIEVLLMSDPVDDFWTGIAGDFEGTPFKSVTRGGADLDAIAPMDKPEEQADSAGLDALITVMRDILGDQVKDIRASTRLTSSPACLVADDFDLDVNLQRILAANKQLDAVMPRIFELNPGHALVKGLAARAADGKDSLEDTVHLLLDQARIAAGDPVADGPLFAERLARVLEKGL